jgi:hypothetical protein
MKVKFDNAEVEVSTEELKDPDVKKWVSAFMKLIEEQ